MARRDMEPQSMKRITPLADGICYHNAEGRQSSALDASVPGRAGLLK
jgi:hypothetical protein